MTPPPRKGKIKLMEALRIPGGTELAHAYIAASMNEEARLGLARTLAAAMLCEADGG